MSSFHVNDIGVHETWLGCGLLLEWTAHADYPTGALTVELVELITRYQGDPEAARALEAKQRAVLAGLLSFEKALELYTEAYLLCVKARKDIHKDEISKLLGLLPPVVRHLSNLPVPKKYLKQKAHGWQQDLSKLLALAYLALEAHKPEEEPVEDIGATAIDPIEEEEADEEDVDMGALSAIFGSGWDAPSERRRFLWPHSWVPEKLNCEHTVQEWNEKTKTQCPFERLARTRIPEKNFWPGQNPGELRHWNGRSERMADSGVGNATG